MRKHLVICSLLALFAVPAMAQDQPPAPPADQNNPPPAEQNKPAAAPSEVPKAVKRTYPTPKWVISGGFTYRTDYVNPAYTLGMIGGYGSLERSYKPWLSAEGEVLGVRGVLSAAQLGPPARTLNIFTFLVGPQIYPFGHRKLALFGHLLGGGGAYVESVPAFSGFGANTITHLTYAWEGGGGLDLNLKPHWGIRLIQVDYSHANFLGLNTGAGSKRVSVGFTYRFGNK
jgi:hypothetical protein